MVNSIHHNYKFVVNDKDVTASIRPNFISLSLTDNAKDDADELTLTLSSKFKRPSYKDKIKVFLGWGNELQFAGLFFVQSTSIRDNRELTIKATGVNFNGDLKQRRNFTYLDHSLGDIAWEVSTRHDLEVRTNFNDVRRFEQKNESDLAFLNRLAKEYNAIFNIKNNTLYFMKQGTEVPEIAVDINRCISSDITFANRTFYKSCKAIFHDTKLNKKVSVITGEGKPVLIKQGKWHNNDDALIAAKNALKRANRGEASGNLTYRGNIYFAGSKLELDKQFYEVTKVTHNISNGWQTTLDFKSFTEK